LGRLHRADLSRCGAGCAGSSSSGSLVRWHLIQAGSAAGPFSLT
jgi:hypothetical protein